VRVERDDQLPLLEPRAELTPRAEIEAVVLADPNAEALMTRRRAAAITVAKARAEITR